MILFLNMLSYCIYLRYENHISKKNVLYLKYYKQVPSINRVNNKCLCVGVSTVPLSIFDFGIYVLSFIYN